MSGLIWSDRTKPDHNCPYDHIEAKTPMGILRIEWTRWKKYDPLPSHPSCALPWGGMVVANNIGTAKDEVQKEWNRFSARISELVSYETRVALQSATEGKDND